MIGRVLSRCITVFPDGPGHGLVGEKMHTNIRLFVNGDEKTSEEAVVKLMFRVSISVIPNNDNN